MATSSVLVGNEVEKADKENELSKISEDIKKQVSKLNKEYELGLNIENDFANYETLYDLELDMFKKFNAKFDDNIKNDKKFKAALRKLIKDLNDFGFITSSEATKKINGVDQTLL